MADKNNVHCPICYKPFDPTTIEVHVNKCIFLNCDTTDENQKRKRSPSPVLKSNTQPKSDFKQKSPVNQAGNRIQPKFDFKQHKSSLNQPGNSSQTSQCPTLTSPDFTFKTPLAQQVQPKSIDDFFGQTHILGSNTVLRKLLEKGDIPNLILWGPPGCGKTSLSSIIREICKQNSKKLKFASLCAATCGVKDVQNIVTVAKNEKKFGRQTVLFMDEIHRYNKRQQDTFLLCVENGDIILIGATTENPSFCINSALLSRCRTIVMEKLQPESLMAILMKAAETLHVNVVDGNNSGGEICKGIDTEALQWIADVSDGDARIALGNLEIVLRHWNETETVINVDDIKEKIKQSHMLYDRAGEEHYNIISAMHKSIRGSDENAALYWTTRMIVSGEDPKYIARRLVRAASEDIGNADPTALQLAVSTMEGCQLLGMPESDVLLAQCAIYLARAPKSREAQSALDKAKKVIANCKGVQPPVPMHIRNAPTKLMKELGYGRLKNGEEFTFLPPSLSGVNFFE